MLLRHAVLEAIAERRIRLAFRRWRRPTVKAGGTLLTAIGIIAVESVEIVAETEIDDADARDAGYTDRRALLADLAGRAGELYRISLRFAGPDPRAALRQQDMLDANVLEEIAGRLARLDTASRRGPWTDAVLDLVECHPGESARTLAARAGREVASFKADVRKLKALGLTESLSVGYRLSPRGRAFRARIGRPS